MDRPPAYQHFTCVCGGRTTITLIRISRGPGPFTGHPTSNIAGIFPSNLPTPGYMRQCRLTPHPARALLAPALTDGDTHPLPMSPRILCRGDSTPAPMTCFPLIGPHTCCPAPHGPGCAFAEGRVLPTRRVGEAAIRLERRAAKQNERPSQQAQRIVRLPGAAATPAHSYTHPTPARQSWLSARRHIQSPPLSEVAFPRVCRSLYPGAFVPNGE